MALEDLKVQHYFLGGGAEHSAEQVRRIVYGHQRGAEGVCEPGDLRVMPLAVPGEGVRVVVGSAFIISNAQGAVREMYFGSVTEQQIVPIPANNTSTARSDLIVMRVRDPFVTGSPWTDPGAGLDDAAAEAARAGAQYVFVERIPSVPAGTTRLQNVPGYETDTAYTLGRVTVPAMTGTVTTAMITNLRAVHTPRREIVMRTYNVDSSDGFPEDPVNQQYPLADTWPITARESGMLAVKLPEWATHVNISMDVIDAEAPVGSTGRGRFWVMVGIESNPNRILTQHGRWSHLTTTVGVADRKPIPKALRGTTQQFFPRAARERGTVSESVKTTWSSSVRLIAEFSQEAE